MTSAAERRVRAATHDDVPALVEVMVAVADEGRLIGREPPLDPDHLATRFQDTIERPDRLSLVATVDDHVVGSLGLVPDGAGHVELGMMLARDARGQGLGSALVRDALSWARERDGIHKVMLQHWPWNAAAHALYRRHGFVVEGYLHQHWRRANGELWDAVIMGLVLR